METLTPKRKQILDFVAAFIGEKGYAPSVRDVASGCNLTSPNAAQFHLDALERQGFIRRARDVSRSIALTEKYADATSIPVLGTIAAGQPIPVPSPDTWSSTPEEMIRLPEDLIDSLQNIYALRVKGTSMIDSMIDDGDIVIMQSTTTVENGEVAAVWLKDKQEVTLKKIYRERGRVCLKPANKQMKPIYCKPENVEVQGKVVAVLRKFTR
jgi:repressor LexA